MNKIKDKEEIIFDSNSIILKKSGYDTSRFYKIKRKIFEIEVHIPETKTKEQYCYILINKVFRKTIQIRFELSKPNYIVEKGKLSKTDFKKLISFLKFNLYDCNVWSYIMSFYNARYFNNISYLNNIYHNMPEYYLIEGHK